MRDSQSGGVRVSRPTLISISDFLEGALCLGFAFGFSFLHILGVLMKLRRASDCVNMQSRLALNSWFLSLYLLSTGIINMHFLALKFLSNLILRGGWVPQKPH